jgi:hypothetical protein
MGIDLSSVNWIFVGLMMALSFVTALLGSLIAFRNRFVGAILGAILFGVGFVAWNYYPHNFGLPILKTTALDGVGTAPSTAASAPSPAAATPATGTMARPSPAAPSPTSGTMAPLAPSGETH